MRWFIAICFKESVLEELTKFSNKLKGNSIKGNFTRRDNLHLTLAFLGEIESSRISEIEECMKSVDLPSFSIQLTDLGKFKRNNGDIYWIGVKESEELNKLYEELTRKLKNSGFQLEDRSYTPHLTLGRKVRIKEDVDINSLSMESPKITVKVDKIHLMLSHRINEQLMYTSKKVHELEM